MKLADSVFVAERGPTRDVLNATPSGQCANDALLTVTKDNHFIGLRFGTLVSSCGWTFQLSAASCILVMPGMLGLDALLK